MLIFYKTRVNKTICWEKTFLNYVWASWNLYRLNSRAHLITILKKILKNKWNGNLVISTYYFASATRDFGLQCAWGGLKDAQIPAFRMLIECFRSIKGPNDVSHFTFPNFPQEQQKSIVFTRVIPYLFHIQCTLIWDIHAYILNINIQFYVLVHLVDLDYMKTKKGIFIFILRRP